MAADIGRAWTALRRGTLGICAFSLGATALGAATQDLPSVASGASEPLAHASPADDSDEPPERPVEVSRATVRFRAAGPWLSVGTIDPARVYRQVCAQLPCDRELRVGPARFAVRYGVETPHAVDGARDVGPGLTLFEVRHQSREGFRLWGQVLVVLTVLGTMLSGLSFTGGATSTPPYQEWFHGLGALGALVSLALGIGAGHLLSFGDMFDVVRLEGPPDAGSTPWDE